MVTNVMSLGRNGLADWVIQRITAIIIGIYTLVLLGWLIVQGEVDHAAWSGFMGSPCMQIANTLMLFSVGAHGWIGLWTVTTDYMTRLQFGGAARWVRLLTQCVIALLTIIYLMWGLVMIWGGA